MQVAAEAACIGTMTIATIAITRNTLFFSIAPSVLRSVSLLSPSGAAQLPRPSQPLPDCTLGMCPFAGIGQDIPAWRMVSVSVWLVRRTADRRIRREADQASAGSAGFVLIAICRDRKATPPFPNWDSQNSGQGNQRPRQSKNKTIKNPAHGKRGRGFWGRVNAPLRTAPPRQRLIGRVDLARRRFSQTLT